MKRIFALLCMAVLFGCGGGGGGTPAQSPTQAAVVSFWAVDFTTNPTSYYPTTATKVAEGVHCYVYLEQGQTVSQTALNAIVSQFDTNIYQGDTTAFGSEPNPGIDGDPKIYILLLNVKDGFAPGGTSYVAGYFDSNSEYDVANSNRKELLYMNVNPTTGVVPGDTEFNATLAHELQHMIHWEQKTRQRSLNDDSWIDEAMAQVAQTYCTYGPNYGAVFDYEHDMINNINHSLTVFDESVGNYGMVYLWAQYMKDQFDTPATQATGHTIFWEMLHSPSKGIDEVNAALAAINSPRNFTTVFQDWAVANYFGNGSTKAIPQGAPVYPYTSIDTWGTHTYDTNLSATLPGLFRQNVATLSLLDKWSVGYYNYTPITNGTVTWNQNPAAAATKAIFINGDTATASLVSMQSGVSYSFTNNGYLIYMNPSPTSYTTIPSPPADTVVHTAIGSVPVTATATPSQRRPRTAAEYLASMNANPLLQKRKQESGRPRPVSVDSYLREREKVLRAQGIRPPF